MKRILATFVVPVVCIAWASPALGRDVLLVPDQYPTIQSAVDAAQPGDKIVVAPGDYAGAVITRPIELSGSGSETRIVSGAPAFGAAGFYVQLSQDGPQDPGASISHFAFECLPFPSQIGMFAGVVVRAVSYTTGRKSYNVEISHNTFHQGFYGVYTVSCDQCAISHNEIVNAETSIMLWAALVESGHNVVAFNVIRSAVPGSDTGQWTKAGVWLRGFSGGAFTNSQVIHNTIERTGGSVSSPARAVLLSTFGPGSTVAGNTVEFNDFRGSENDVQASPALLLDLNEISRNLGANRGH